MDTAQIYQLHEQLLDLYRHFMLPVANKFFMQENTAQVKPSVKYAATLVTQADLAINRLLELKLPKILPGAKVISEESAAKSLVKYVFVVDPIDGTHAFVKNLDSWGISIALCEDGKIIYSIIFYPNCKTEFYYAIEGQGAFAPNGKINLTPYFQFKPVLITAPSSRKIGRALIDLTKGKYLSFRTADSAVYAGYTLFRGGTDFVIFDHLFAWDIIACVFIAEQMGLAAKWFSPQLEIKQDIDFTTNYYTLMIYKPDAEKALLASIVETINSVTASK